MRNSMNRFKRIISLILAICLLLPIPPRRQEMVQLAIAGYNRQNNVDWETMPSTGGCMRNVISQLSQNSH